MFDAYELSNAEIKNVRIKNIFRKKEFHKKEFHKCVSYSFRLIKNKIKYYIHFPFS